MPRQLCWLSKPGTGGEKVLYLRVPNEPWKPYTQCPEYAVPDHRIPGGSKGWATYQKLIKQGWILIPSARASEFGKIAVEAEILNN